MKYRVAYKVKGKFNKVYHTDWYNALTLANLHLNDISTFEGIYDAKIVVGENIKTATDNTATNNLSPRNDCDFKI